jgi:beta-glucosidase
MDREQTDASIAQDDPANAATAQKVASEGIVLLRNAGSLLPLDRAKVKHLFVMGPNAEEAVIGGGGSAWVTPFHSVSVVDGIRAVAGPGVVVDSLAPATERIYRDAVFQPATGQGPGLSAEYFSNRDLSGAPLLQRVDRAINFQWGYNDPVPGIAGASAFSARWQGTLVAPETGRYVFAASSDDGSRVYLDNHVILEMWSNHPTMHKEIEMDLVKGETHHLRIEYYNAGGDAAMRFGWGRGDLTPEQKSQIASADAVIYAGGLNEHIEHEGSDRTWVAPPSQTQELRDVLALNPRVILAVNAGANLGFGDVAGQVPALLWCWYPGENGNTELAKIIFGDTNPSGHLPDTFEKRFEDSPAYGNFPGDEANGGSVNLAEGIYVGYRWYDKKSIAPAYPFGFGLSYTTFALRNLQVRSERLGDARRFAASVDVTNTGSRAGAEVVQLYMRPHDAADRPIQELKAFQRVELSPGETKSVTLPLTAKDFALFDEKKSGWVVPPGSYQIAVGTSSRDIAQQADVKLP